MPMANYFALLAGGTKAALALNLALVCGFVAILICRRDRLIKLLREESARKSSWLWITAMIAIVIVLGYVMTIDVQVGNNLFMSAVENDSAKHTAVADSIGRNQLPAINPMFFPGHVERLFYYYLWHLSASIIAAATGSPYNCRGAVLSGEIWCAVTFVVALIFFSSYFKFAKVDGKYLPLVALALLPVGNLYCINYLAVNLPVVQETHQPWVCLPVVSWCDKDQLTSWLPLLFWVPQHVTGFIAGLFGGALMLDSSNQWRDNRGTGKF